uniref:UVR domain-containing protein n=1 Tax=Pyramimonas obovata TaxID=1411642 RepID=A0A7S0RME8_9CHLO|eukprot:CAMPEP_0118929668 /NCGR_PEP_ID=MMETSP1169-20130426/6606_1 /TAXON_ID=36882 /ORGANISM="Pyramimonas obovata, Strain CCMP722" /LENGTH=317 /DNA_ID=CAMNT_0006871907 /DNA_START=25 /DNA_END=978 /DNA_ORIENTATION=+
MSAYSARGTAVQHLAQLRRSGHSHCAARCARLHVPLVRSPPVSLRHAVRIGPPGKPPLHRARHSHTCCSSNPDRDTALTEQWDRAQLLARKLEIAVNEEDYGEAARLRDERATLVGKLSLKEQMMLKAINKLRTGEVFERREAIEELAELKDQRCTSALFDALHDPDGKVSERAEGVIWDIFCSSGDPVVDSRLNDGMLVMQRVPDLEDARDIFSEVIGMAPTFAEGYNKRATVYYLLQEFSTSIKDCERTLELEPSHFGALSGLGLCHIALGDFKSALSAFQRAVQVNPRLLQIASYMKELEVMVAEDDENKEAEG